ncbi:MAG: hypothetical protein KatS3mg027_1692 [Bacteroidia bacterium]|nr:MAG: hypothetical protein KatS3mg027_1692 [Bacteroidia bacterium]
MNKQDIIQRLKDLLEQPALEVAKEVKQLEKEYKKIWTAEFEKAKQQFIDEGGKAKDFTYSNTPEDETIPELLAKFEKKLESEEKKLEQLRAENKRKKEELLSQLELLSEADIKDITPIIKKLREIQNQWKEIKELKKADYAELQRKYNLLLDKINENIKAFDTLQQYDLQKNTELKEELLKKFEQLLELDDYKKIEDLLKTYKKEWNQIGNVVSEKYAEIKTRFNELNQKIKEKLDQFYQSLEEEKQKNLELKKELLNALKIITETIQNNENVFWKEINEQVQKIRNEWEKIGHIPSEFLKEINEQYNHFLDIYFNGKRKHQEIIQKKQEEIRQIKQNLINELENIIQENNFDKNSKRVLQIQQEWKKYYLRNKEENDQLNQQFKELCDKFFEAKRHFEKERIQQEKDNLVKKLELIHQLKETKFDTSNPEAVLEQIQNFIKEFNSIGHVPIEEKDKVNDEFFSKINQLYAELNLSEEKRIAIQYKSKLQQQLQSSSTPFEILKKEEKFIKKKITELENEITQIDNNLAFFKNAKPDNPIFKDAFNKKEKINHYIQEWKAKLNIVKGMMGDFKASQQQTS